MVLFYMGDFFIDLLIDSSFILIIIIFLKFTTVGFNFSSKLTFYYIGFSFSSVFYLKIS